MIPFMDSKDKESEKCLDSQLWHACAGGMVQMPALNSRVYYFPQGHAEHASGNVDFRQLSRIPAYVLCRVLAVKFMADTETDEVYAKIRLVPVRVNDREYDEVGLSGLNCSEGLEKPASFAKTLTQSDANNGGGFSVPRYCAETIFPRLDYSADPPVQTILAKDVHGEIWKFRHIYRGTPRRHLLTTGWSTFVSQKKLVAGDSIVFLRAECGDLCVGIRRAKRGIFGESESASGWNPAGGNCSMPYGGLLSSFLRDDEKKLLGNSECLSSGSGCVVKGKVSAESVVEAARLAADGQLFEVVYYPRASTPEFCVRASLVNAALRIRWCSGMRFKMAFETEDSSRISWFMGTISSVQIADPIRWPNSPWRLLQVSWDEPDLLHNVKRVSPWLVELVSNMPAIHLSPFSPPRKKLRLPQHPEIQMNDQLGVASFSGSLLGPSSAYSCLDLVPAGMQGARHAPFGASLSDIHNSLLSSFFPPYFPPIDHSRAQTRDFNCSSAVQRPGKNEEASCSLTIGNAAPDEAQKSDEAKASPFVLFGRTILTEQQISVSGSGDITGVDMTRGSSVGSGSTSQPQEPSTQNRTYSLPDKGSESESDLGTGRCKILAEAVQLQTLEMSDSVTSPKQQKN
uniref:Auxin response factor n=1 Tax=Kalanchoe fedtschenkoi TaxID=63787 RepID=A0A7N0R9B1_KALFE